MKIYRLEVWIAEDDLHKWYYLPLTDFYVSKAYLELELESYKKVLDNLPSDGEGWKEYLSEKTNVNILDTRLEYPEIREYDLKGYIQL